MSRENDLKLIEELQQYHRKIRAELEKVIHGQTDVIDKLLICIFSRGHSLLMGVPGLAKTLMIKSLSETMHLDFNRIQFTPDLMPSDITGTDILQENLDGKREFKFIPGPIFANIVLADEINRTSPKTQAALLEAMQERQATVLGRNYKLPDPFFVLATQNPIEQEGTYPLPEAQLDRFMFFIEVGYPEREVELAVVKHTAGIEVPKLDPIIDVETIIKFQELVRRVPVAEHIYEYVVDMVRMTRPGPNAPDWVNQLISWGAGPRAMQYLVLAARTHAAINGNYMVSLEDIKAMAPAVLVHRMQLTFLAESENVKPVDLVDRLIKEMDKKRYV